MLEQIYWFRIKIVIQNWKYLGPHCALVETNEDEGSSPGEFWRQYSIDCLQPNGVC
jgi:hypothetical protein